jgi:mannitol/fructose-specific phosphotransferase system IIA component (Ntr-type)
MTTIEDILRPEDVILELKADTAEAAIAETVALLKNDSRVTDWDALLSCLQKLSPCLPAGEDFAICMPHARTDCLSSLVMSVGRSSKGITFPNSALPVRYIFCIGVEVTMAADYPRIAGLVARIVKDPEAEAQLLAAKTRGEFVAALSRLEAKL